jgi:hypothetical protein
MEMVLIFPFILHPPKASPFVSLDRITTVVIGQSKWRAVTTGHVTRRWPHGVENMGISWWCRIFHIVTEDQRTSLASILWPSCGSSITAPSIGGIRSVRRRSILAHLEELFEG